MKSTIERRVQAIDAVLRALRGLDWADVDAVFAVVRVLYTGRA